MLSHPLLPKLKELRLGGMAESLEERAALASERQMTGLEFLALLLDDELDRRTRRRQALREREAGFENPKYLSQFDFAAVPALDRGTVLELATCAFIGAHENWLIHGPAGVGKSHLAAAVGHEAIKRGYRALACSTHRLLADLFAARADGSHARRLQKVCSVHLLILDDFGLRPANATGAEDLYEIIQRRYERGSILLTSNRAPGEWAEVFGDGLLASAALDRLTHHARVTCITGDSYRQRQRRQPTGGAGLPQEVTDVT
jgi:DNA replication protein DnaC